MQKAKYPLPLAHDRCTHAAHNGRRARTRPRGRGSPQPPSHRPGARGPAVTGSRSALAPGLLAPQRGPGEAAASGRDAGPRGAGGAPTPTCGPKRGGARRGPGSARGAEAQLSPRRTARARRRELGGRLEHGPGWPRGPTGPPPRQPDSRRRRRRRRTHLLPGLPFHHICTADPGRIKRWAGGWGQTQGGGDCKSCCLLAPPRSFPDRTDSLRLRFSAKCRGHNTLPRG